MNMKTISESISLFILLIFLFFSACSSTPQVQETEVITPEPSFDNSIVESEVTKYYKNLELPWDIEGSTIMLPVDDTLSVASVEIIDRLINEKDAKIIGLVTFRLKTDIIETSGNEEALSPLVGYGKKISGEEVTSEHIFTFLKYEKAWRLDHSQLDE